MLHIVKPAGAQVPAEDLYITDERGKPFPVVGNVLIALRNSPILVDCFGFDSMTRMPMLMKEIGNPSRSAKKEPLKDEDITVLQHWLQEYGGLPRIGREPVRDAVAQRCRERSYHPVKDWLDSLEWDRKERLENWLETYLGAEGPLAYHQGIGVMFLISMVARIYEPGCRVDHMLVLEGAQGILKSTTCRVLAGEWFSDNLPDLGSKDSSQHLRGKWLIEVAEMHAMNKADTALLKKYLTRTEECYRPPYGRLEVKEPRQCIFIGTTNKQNYLRDETGNRRFWPVKCGKIDIEQLSDDRDQLFAEAVVKFNCGVQWWPDSNFEFDSIGDEQDARYESDAWEEPIANFLKGLEDEAKTKAKAETSGITKDKIKAKTTVLAVARGALGYEPENPVPDSRHTPINKLGTADQRRIVVCLTKLGWEPKRSKGERWWGPVR
jgi:predicted P-loop ATPase